MRIDSIDSREIDEGEVRCRLALLERRRRVPIRRQSRISQLQSSGSKGARPAARNWVQKERLVIERSVIGRHIPDVLLRFSKFPERESSPDDGVVAAHDAGEEAR